MKSISTGSRITQCITIQKSSIFKWIPRRWQQIVQTLKANTKKLITGTSERIYQLHIPKTRFSRCNEVGQNIFNILIRTYIHIYIYIYIVNSTMLSVATISYMYRYSLIVG
jgi:hypothetical protein